MHATIWVNTKTVSGDVGQVVSIESPHTRTGKDGNFLILSKELKKPPFPFGFGTRVDKFNIVVATVDKSGKKEIDINDLQKKKIVVTIYLEDIEKAWQKELQHVPPERFQQEKELREFSGLQAFYNYCFTGRFSAEVTTVKDGCDNWELDYIIKKHERYLENYKKNIEEKGYSLIFEQLASLYERKGEFKKAAETLKKSIALMESKGLTKFTVWQRNKAQIEIKIEELLKKQK
ncbi:MAG: tetratricopeptide repeat protein [Thermodesulfobacteriota bacterium]|nr:tetratricopeptide repeat protein [Thermodesulfobacteriota bacterium]